MLFLRVVLFFEYIIQTVIKPGWERYGMRNRRQDGNAIAKKNV